MRTTEPIKNHQYVNHSMYPNTCAVCEKPPFHDTHSPFRPAVVVSERAPEDRIDFISKRTYDSLCDHLKSEAKEKAYEPPFPLRDTRPSAGNMGSVEA